MRFAVINISVTPTQIKGKQYFPVVNVIEYEGAQYNPNGLLVQSDTAGIGQLYSLATNTFVDEPNPKP